MYLASDNAYSTLAGAISDVATTLTVSVGHGDRFPVIEGVDYTFCTLEDAGGNYEIIKITERVSASDTMTIERGQLGTDARAWGAGDSIELRLVSQIVIDAIAHYTDNVDAHAASAIGVTPAGGIEADNVQEALEELDSDKQALSEKDAPGGYVGLTLRKINFWNALGTFKSFFTNANTAARTYTFQDRDGTIADNTDLATKANLAGATFTGPVNEKKAAVASAASPDIWAGGNVIDYTGTTQATDFADAPAAGARRVLVCAAACSFVNNANLLIHGGKDFTAASGDIIEVIAITTTVFRLVPHKANGKPVINGREPGEIQFMARKTPPEGWLKMNGQTIGSAASGATLRANADTLDLYTVLWNDCANTELPIQDSAGVASVRGASAAADFAANKRLPVPDMRGEIPRGLDDGRGVDTGRVFGSAQGDAMRNLTGDVGINTGSSSGLFGSNSGVFGLSNGNNEFLEGGGTFSGTRYMNFNFDASRQVPTASEFRMRNVAFSWFIKL
jgi:hypothetical protein